MPGAKIVFPYRIVKSINGIEPDADGNLVLNIAGNSLITIAPTFPVNPSQGDMHIDNLTWDVFYREADAWVLKGNIKGTAPTTDSVFEYREEIYIVETTIANVHEFTLRYAPDIDVPVTLSVNGLIQSDNYQINAREVTTSNVYVGDVIRVNYAYRRI